MRSSKREIVLGLSIGVGLSVVLAGLGQSYVDNQRSWPAQGGLETASLRALPQPAASVAALEEMPEAPSATPGSIDKEPIKAPLDKQPIGKEPVAPKPAEAGLAEPRAVALLPSSRVEVVALEAKPEAPAPRASRDTSRQVSKRASSRRVDAPPSDGVPLPEKTSLSPSESAGLGLDLPF